MFEIKGFEPRSYQADIFETSKDFNTLVCLPTGTGKTKNAIMLAVQRLNKYKDSKVLICSPTKPLSNQIYEEFKDCSTVGKEDIILLTGAISPGERKKLYGDARIIVATPQTIQKDLENNRVSLDEFSMLCIDEAHRSRQKFANTVVAKKYLEQAENPRILALTASPGGTREKIDEICENLFIDKVEILDDSDERIKEYVQEKKADLVEVELPESLKKIHGIVKGVYKEKLKGLRKLGFSKPLSVVSKKDLLKLQAGFRKDIQRRNVSAYYGVSLTAQLLKIDHALELLETQGLGSFIRFLDKLKEEETKAAKVVLNTREINSALNFGKHLLESGIVHPKIEKLSDLVKEELSKNPDSKVIIFANFRDTVRAIYKKLEDLEGVNPVMLMGQKEGITQKKQIETIKEYEEGKYNVLIGTSISEEGLNISGGAELAIFYDAVSSEIRKIQRVGRVGRIKPGRIIFLLTKNTRDQAYYWSAYRKEKLMKKTLHSMQNRSERQSKL